MSESENLDALFLRLQGGDECAREELFSALYAELREIAGREMGRQGAGHTLQPTALVNEAFLKLTRGSAAVTDRRHFMRVAAAAMRQILIDHARAKASRKRGGVRDQVELDALVDSYEERSGGLLALDAALKRLEERDPELVRLVELRFFSGQSVEEAARALGTSPRSAGRRWQMVRRHLKAELDA